MKRLKNLLSFFVLFGFVVANLNAEEIEKRYHKSYPKDEVRNLSVNNKFGDIVVGDYGGDEVTIDVIITVKGKSEAKAKRVLDNINILFDHSGLDLSARTRFSDPVRNVSFQIDYKINIPKDRNLEIENKFGDVMVNELTGQGTFKVSYGSIRGQSWDFPKNKPGDISVSYGRIDVDRITDASLYIRYSKYFGDEGGALKIDTRYSEVEVEKVNMLSIDSRYDKYRFEKVNRLKGEAAYSGFRIEECTSELTLENSYGNLQVSRIPASFERINVAISYGKIFLEFDKDATYKIDAEVSYSAIDYPQSDRINRSRSTSRTTINGIIGKQENTNSTVRIRNKFGGVKLGYSL